jgi:alkaline phosphatase D
MRSITRRSFLAAAAGGTLLSCRSPGGPLLLPAYPFALGVASGDPSPDGVVLWTRLAPRPLEEGGGMQAEPVEVAWTLAEDEALTKGVRRGTALASPALAHSVHVEAAGLDPDRPYWYRFEAAGARSPLGRTRTLPPPDSMPARLRLALASCQHWEQGLFTAYEHMVREDADLVLHVGDYIYEGAGQANRLRKHIGPECATLEGYRQRYGQYKSDPALQAMHAAAPWLVTTDDHEFDNNCAGAVSEEKNVPASVFLRRRAAAYQAYYEHMPLRRSSLPVGPDMRLYRRLAWGRLADLHVLDTRQYRTDQPNGDGNKPPTPELLDPKGTLLGEVQRGWLQEGLAGSSALWNVLGQQVMFARVDRLPGEGVTYSMDQWPGYEFERRALLRFLQERKVSNPVVLAGDIHTNWANDLVADFDGLGGRVVASEFVGTSISSGGDGTAAPKDLDRLLADNPFVRFHNAERGYVTCDVTPKLWRTQFRTLSYVLRPGSPIQTRAAFVVEPGRPGPRRA